MPAERAPMRKIHEAVRLKHALGLRERQIAVAVSMSRSTVAEYLRRAGVVGITRPVPEGMDEAEFGAEAVHAAVVRGEADTGPAGLEPRSQGAEAARRYAASAVGGVPRRAR